MVNRKRLTRTIQALLRFDSQNPQSDERAIARWVGAYLGRLGMSVNYHEYAPRRTNVIGTLKGSVGARRLLLSPHLDTVPAGSGWSVDPFGGALKGGRVYGRGATDCKGSLASALEALHIIRERKIGLRMDVVLAATADEERGSALGAIPLLEKGLLDADGAVILDGDGFDALVAQKGLAHFKVKISGKKAHGAYPWRGVNAIEQAVAIIAKLKRASFGGRPHALLREPTVNIGTIKGGDKVNIVADHCEFDVDMRFLPGTDSRELMAKVRSIIRQVTRRSVIEVESIQQPYEIARSEPVVQSLASSLRKNRRRVAYAGSEGATVVTFFRKRRIPAVGFGFGTKGQAHATDEYVRIADLCDGAEILVDLMRDFDHACASNRSNGR